MLVRASLAARWSPTRRLLALAVVAASVTGCASGGSQEAENGALSVTIPLSRT